MPRGPGARLSLVVRPAPLDAVATGATLVSMATEIIIATRARLTLDQYEGAKIAAIQANQSLTDWLGDAIRARLAAPSIERADDGNPSK